MNIIPVIIITLASGFLVVAGCGKEEGTATMTDSPDMSADTASTQMDSTQPDATPMGASGMASPGMASGEASDMSPQQAEQASDLQREIDRLQVNIAALEVKIAEKSDQARERFAAEVEALKQKQAALEARATELKTSSADSMRDLLNRVNDSLEVMSRQVEPASE